MSSIGGVDVSITNGSRYEPAVMGAHHQRLAHASLPVYEPAVINPAITAGSGPAITIDLNPTVPKTVGDALLEPAVIGVAVVVCRLATCVQAMLVIVDSFQD